MSIIEVKNLKRTYGKGDTAVHALKGASLTFNEGEFTAITGRSGSGKSTLLHLIGGLDKPSGGEVFLEGKNLYDIKDKALTIMRRRRIGFIFQSFNLVSEITAFENIMLPLDLDSRKADMTYVNEVIDLLGLRDRLTHFPSQLSGGQQQRVAIARALITKPAVILADEPTGNLDAKSGEEVLRLLRLSQKKYNQTIIMVTHDNTIAEISDRIINIADGKVAYDSVRAN